MGDINLEIAKPATVALAVALALPSAGLVHAQERSARLDEILVTATRRQESIQDVPVSVSVIAGEDLKNLGMLSAVDIVSQIPNMEFANTGPLPVFSVRGVQLLEILALGNEPPVAVYFDDVYIGTTAGQTEQLFDLESVQVLRGPQGTLFGRNSTGGLVNYTARKPTDEFDAYVTGRFGRFQQRIVEGAVGGPVADGVRVRAALRYNRDNGFQKNLADPPGGRFGQTDTLSGRILADFDITESASALVKVHASRTRNQSPLWGTYGRLDPETGAICSAEDIFANRCVNRDGFQSPPRPTEGFTDRPRLDTDIDAFGANLTLTWDMGFAELISITAYDKFDRFYEEDVDATAAPRFLVDYFEDARQFAQEIRLAGEFSGGRYVTGLYYFDDARETGFSLPQLLDALAFLGPVFGTAGLRNRADVDTRSYAAFGQIDFDLTENLTAFLGARYTDERKTLFMSDNPENPASPNIAIVTDEIDDNQLTGTVGLSWKPSDDVLLYSTIGRGFKSGVFNTRGGVYSTIVNQGFVPNTSVGSERVTSYELGTKSTWADGSILLNAALFYMDYRNLQITAVDRSIPDVLLSNLINAGDADIYGAEIELAAKLGSSWTVNLGLGLLDTKISSDTEIAGVPIDGNELPKAPKWSLNGLVRYELPTDVARGRMAIQTEFKMQGREWTSAEGIPEERQDGYEVVNLRLLWDSNDGRYSASLFVDNIFDKEYWTFNFQSFDYVNVAWQRPRWWGASATIRF